MTNEAMGDSPAMVPAGFSDLNWTQGFGRQIGPLYKKLNGDGTYVQAFRVQAHHANGMKNCHGGMLMAFADMAFGYAVTLAHHPYWVTVRLVTDFLAPAHMGDWVEGTAEITGGDEGLIAVRGRIWSGERVLMTGTGLFKVLAERP